MPHLLSGHLIMFLAGVGIHVGCLVPKKYQHPPSRYGAIGRSMGGRAFDMNLQLLQWIAGRWDDGRGVRRGPLQAYRRLMEHTN